MLNYTYPTVCLVIIIVCLTYFLKQCPSCYKNLTKDSFDSYDVLDKVYNGAFISESDLGVQGCPQVCVNETRCIQRCDTSGCSGHCGTEEGCRWICPHQTLPHVRYSNESLSDTNQTFPDGPSFSESEFEFTQRARRNIELCEEGGTSVGPEPCVTCIYMWAPMKVLNPAGNSPANLHVIQFPWAAKRPARYQVVYAGRCGVNSPDFCKVHSRPIKVLVSRPNRITSIADLASINHGFQTIYIDSHCGASFQ